MDRPRKCQLPGCDKDLPGQVGAAGRPPLYCCASHRVQAAQLRAIDRRALSLAKELTESEVQSARAVQESARSVREEGWRLLAKVKTLCKLVMDFDRSTAPMVERTKNAMLAMPDLSHKERQENLQQLEQLGALRHRMIDQARETLGELEAFAGERADEEFQRKH
jgi:hypothetical protein